MKPEFLGSKGVDDMLDVGHRSWTLSEVIENALQGLDLFMKLGNELNTGSPVTHITAVGVLDLRA